jgi:glycosyltransferase involved in cell wall biosynthesis
MYPTPTNPPFGIFVKEQAESIRALGADVDVLFVNAKVGRLRHKAYVQAFPRLWRALSRAQYDVIHAHYVFSGLIARAQWRAPLVVTHHGPELRFPVQGRLCRWTRDLADEVIVVADWMVKDLGAPQAHVIPCGIDLTLFRPMSRDVARQALGLSPDRRYVLFAGEWWRPEKRFHLVEQAMERVRERHPDVELLRVSHEPKSRIPLYMNAADVLAMVSWVEGGPLVVKEAMACGLPIVATEVGDAWDVIGNTDSCYRVGSDPEQIADRIVAAITPPRRTIGPTRMAAWSCDVIAGLVMQVYERACGRVSRAIPPIRHLAPTPEQDSVYHGIFKHAKGGAYRA